MAGGFGMGSLFSEGYTLLKDKYSKLKPQQGKYKS